MPNYDTDQDKNVGMTPMAAVRRPTAHETVEHNMTNHAPTGPTMIEDFESLRRAAKLFAHTVVDVCPDTRERSLALTNAEQALMWAVASIARNH